jgi:hypothetical protein
VTGFQLGVVTSFQLLRQFTRDMRSAEKQLTQIRFQSASALMAFWVCDLPRRAKFSRRSLKKHDSAQGSGNSIRILDFAIV